MRCEDRSPYDLRLVSDRSGTIGHLRPDPPVSVLVVSQPSSVWGAQLRLMDLAGPLAERGIELTLAGPESGPLRDQWERRGLPYTTMRLPLHRGIRRRHESRRAGARQLLGELGSVMVAAPQIARAARSFDVVLSFSLSMHLETAIAGRLARRPAVMEVVDIVRPGLGRRVLRVASRLATTTVVNSVATAGNLDGDAHRARVIHPGVDLDRFQPGPCDDEVRRSLGGRRGTPLVGVVGRVDPGKGIEVLLDAMAATDGPVHDAGLVVVGDVGVGDAEYVDGLRSRSRALGDRVTFAGRRSDVPAVLRCLDVLVNASDAEPFGRSWRPRPAASPSSAPTPGVFRSSSLTRRLACSFRPPTRWRCALRSLACWATTTSADGWAPPGGPRRRRASTCGRATTSRPRPTGALWRVFLRVDRRRDGLCWPTSRTLFPHDRPAG